MRKARVLFFAFFIAGAFSGVFAQETELTSAKVFSFRFDNDFVFGTDRYFTNGFDFGYCSDSFKHFFANKFLFPEIKNGKSVYTVSAVQKIYTPQEKESEEPVIGDRPFSANLYLTYSQKVFTDSYKQILTFRFLLGIMGKYAFGEEVQNGIHSLLPPSGEVLGWDNQLSSALLLSYSVKYQNLLAENKTIKIYSGVEGEIGQPDTRIGSGLFFFIGENDFKTRYVGSNKLKWQIKFFPKLLFVFYNSNLQGGWFTDNIYEIKSEDVTRIVFNLRNDLTVFYKRVSFSVGYEILTKEFETGKAHIWFFTKIDYKF